MRYQVSTHLGSELVSHRVATLELCSSKRHPMKLVDGADVLVCAPQSVITEPSTKSRDFHVNNKNASFLVEITKRQGRKCA